MGLAILVLLTLFAHSKITSASSSFSSLEQAAALLKWETSLSSPITSWNSSSSSSSPCSWFGVRCNIHGSVNSLNLSDANLQGTLSLFPFASLPNLYSLDLSMNELHGSIPPEIGALTNLQILYLNKNLLNGSIPEEIGRLRSLSTLVLASNHINGSIPDSVGDLRNLSFFGACNNLLSGPIPPSIGNLRNLSFLALCSNSLSGQIPPSIGELRSLEFLRLFNNSLSGPIPPSIGNLTALQWLSLCPNKLSGVIPTSVGNLTSLTTLQLCKNQLSGSIPQELGNLKLLVELQLNENEFSGSIPPTFGNMTELRHLDLYNNHLSGSIPMELENLELISLAIFHNQLTGHLPQRLCQNQTLQVLDVNNNKLFGPMPRSLKNCTGLVRWSFKENRFTGDLSLGFGTYPDLNFMDLSGNSFYGEISGSWGRYSQNLNTFSISNNKITGFLPPEVGNLTNLGTLDLSSNQILGHIPIEFLKLKSLLILHLDDNHLSGAIPQELGLLTQLSSLNLSMNLLNGSIPDSLRDCQKLNSLSLSNNNFSQSIPGGLGKLTQLNFLDLSQNSLTGEIPPELRGLGSLETLNISYNLLSGSIPNAMSEMPPTVYIDVSFNDLEGPIPKGEVFLNATYKQFMGNRLCGNITGLQPCDDLAKKSGPKYALIIALPLVLALMLVCVFYGIFLWYQKRNKKRKDTQKVEEIKAIRSADIFSVCQFDGKKLYEDILAETEDFDELFCIGKGGHGSVYKANLPSGETVAVKRLPKFSGSTSDYHKTGFLKEIQVLTAIKHRNIVKLHGFCSTSKHSFLVYEYLEKGSLARTLSSEEEGTIYLDWKKRVNIIQGVSNALSYLHHDCIPPIVHRDITSNNVLLNSEYEARVSDFGTAKFLQPDSSNWTAAAGTYGYIAPELAYTMKVTEKSDVYSFGVLTLEVLRGSHPGDLIPHLLSCEMNMIQLKDFLDPRLEYPSAEHDEEVLSSILEQARACLNADPQSRPTMHFVSTTLLSIGY